jgi:NADH-quinone oxidoreductase subunit M
LALAQHDLKRTIGYVAVSQSGLTLVGLASLNEASVGGALLASVGVGIAIAALYLMVRALEARVGTTDVRQLGGLVVHAPRAAALFFLFAAAAAGFPGSMSFVGEDLLVHGVLDAHPIAATILVLITALNGITLLRAFMRTFLGRASSRSRLEGPVPMPDLLLRERAVALMLLAVLVGFGLMPGPVLRARAEAVESLTGAPRSTEVALRP